MDKSRQTYDDGYNTPKHGLLQYMNFNIGVLRILEVHYLQGNNFIEFVTYTKSPSGNYAKVSTKCIKLSLECFRVLLQNFETIDKHFEILKETGQAEYRVHLGEHFHLKIDKNIKCVDIRKHYIPAKLESISSNLQPGIPGVGLKLKEFENFRDILPELVELSQVMTITPCSEREDHTVFEVVANCKICNPNKVYHM